MNLNRISALTYRIIRQFRRDPRTLALLLVVPVAIMSLIGYIYLSGASTSASVGVIDDQTTPLTQGLYDQLERNERITAVLLSENAARQQINDGELTAFVDLLAQPPHVVVDGSDPGATQTAISALQSALPATALSLSDGGSGAPTQFDVDYLHGGPDFAQIDYLSPVFIGFFAFFFVFLLTSVSFLRERVQGSIERLLVSPLSRMEIVTGYMVGFSIFAALQSIMLVGFTVLVLRIHFEGNLLLVFLVTLLLTLGAVNLGIFLSTFARTELQVVQFIPMVIIPQALLSGILWPIDTMPGPLQWLAQILPLTYANEALRDIMIRGDSVGALWFQLLFLTGFAVLMLALSSTTLRREVA